MYIVIHSFSEAYLIFPISSLVTCRENGEERGKIGNTLVNV